MQYGQWIGRAALAVIFLFNALGIVDQTRPAHELAAHGAPAALVPTLIMAGRGLQLLAGIALVIGWQERLAALLLALFRDALRTRFLGVPRPRVPGPARKLPEESRHVRWPMLRRLPFTHGRGGCAPR
jgi:hypothetical protein